MFDDKIFTWPCLNTLFAVTMLRYVHIYTSFKRCLYAENYTPGRMWTAAKYLTSGHTAIQSLPHSNIEGGATKPETDEACRKA